MIGVWQRFLSPSRDIPVQHTGSGTDNPAMRTRLASTIALTLVLASCSGGDDVSQLAEGTVQTTATTPAAPVTTIPSSPPTTLEPEPTPDLAVFIAAINEAVEGTTYEDAPLDDPEVFIGVGQLFCELLDEDLSVDDVLEEYVTALEDEDTGSVTDDDALVAGVLMGVTLEILCPEHQTD